MNIHEDPALRTMAWWMTGDKRRSYTVWRLLVAAKMRRGGVRLRPPEQPYWAVRA